MAVVPTGEIFKTLTFDGQSSGDYGVYITGEAVYNAPARDVEMVTIPGRNGQLALDKGRFENIEVSYPAGIFADNEADFAQAVSDFRNFLASRSGYCRLENDYNPNEYRMAIYKSGLEVDPKLLRAGEFDIVFDCKPQRWLKDGETAVTIGEWGETETASGDIVTVENEDGVLAVKSLEVDLEPIQDLNGYSKPWVGGAGKNKLPPTTTQTVLGVTFTANADGTVTANGTATSSSDCYFVGASGVYDYVGNITTGSYKLSGNLLGGGTSTLFIVQEGGTVLAQQTDGNDATVTLDSTKKYRIFIRVNSGKTLSNQKYYPMLRLATETSTFEPYENICPISGHDSVDVIVSPTTSASDGTTYTTSLGRTVYGGTLDVVSGVLTVDRANIASYNGETLPSTWISDRDVYASGTTPTIGAQVVYKLATPQTYQLTAQQIELLTGTNNIWSDSGEVAVEYGQDPSVLFNPTLFESSPLLRIWGYGTVGVNGYEIELENGVLGNIVLLDAQTRAVAGTSTKLPRNLMNVGNPFTLDASSFFWAFSFDRTRIANVNIRSVSDSDSSRFRSEKAGDGYYTNVSPLNFVYGTDSTISNISTIQATYTDRDDHTGTFTLRLVTQIRYYAESGYLAYTRNISELPGSWLSMDYKSNLSTRGQVVGDSTVSVLGSPTIIDCDLGEAYKYARSPISLNRYVDLGSDLPILAPGKNEITYDDTITQLRIVPNWWKI